MTGKYIRTRDGYTTTQVARMIAEYIQGKMTDDQKKEFFKWVSLNVDNYNYLVGEILSQEGGFRLAQEMGLVDDTSYIKMYGPLPPLPRLPLKERIKTFFWHRYLTIDIYVRWHWQFFIKYLRSKKSA